MPYCILIPSVMICDGKLKSLHQFILNLYWSATTQGNKSTKKGYNSQCMAFVARQGQSCCTGQISGQTVPLLDSSDLIKKARIPPQQSAQIPH